ncbi:probable glutathione S-transferase 5 [Haliotis rubra]|uniref:probable glutathione S-transferase 5 n=1 Tax=Haliotis rubra TaxID=36100 RepID=UPI001EE4EF7C|nr:probable glutathione S-transferase 5 [Haliotis rubra]XP_046580223.1 probable glutathione S-transferase 5 [Haliotis rubra]
MPTYKFKSFNARGFGEVSRILFALAGQEYTDERFTQETWPAEKPNVLLGQMPVLEVDGAAYGQSSAIARFLARRFNFYGSGDIQALEVDQVLGVVQDIINAMIKAFFEKDEARKAQFKTENKEEKLPLYLGMLEKLLVKNGSTGFFVGKSITLADVTVFDICDKIQAMVDFDKFPQVKKCRESVASNPKVKKWVDTRPVTEN